MTHEYFGGPDVTNVLIDSFLESEKQNVLMSPFQGGSKSKSLGLQN